VARTLQPDSASEDRRTEAPGRLSTRHRLGPESPGTTWVAKRSSLPFVPPSMSGYRGLWVFASSTRTRARELLRPLEELGVAQAVAPTVTS